MWWVYLFVGLWCFVELGAMIMKFEQVGKPREPLDHITVAVSALFLAVVGALLMVVVLQW